MINDYLTQKKKHWTGHFVGFRIVQSIRAQLTYHTTFLLVIIIIGCVLTYVNYSILKIKYVNHT